MNQQRGYMLIGGPGKQVADSVTEYQAKGWVAVGGLVTDGEKVAQAMVLPAPAKEVTDYVLAAGDSRDALQKEVNAMLKQGWSLHDGPTTSSYTYKNHGEVESANEYIQAMVKYK